MSSVKCPECNLTNWSTAISCKRCGYLFQPMENIPSAESVNPINQFDEFQPQSLADFPVQSNSQQSWTGNPRYSNNNQQTNYQNVKQKQGLAITSLVLGVIGCFFTAPIGLVFGIVSLVKANRYPREYGGKGMAIAGIILNIIGIIAIPIVAAIAIPNLLAARRAANESAAIYSLRKIAEAENAYLAKMGTRNCADLFTLSKNNMIDPVLAGGTKSGYKFTLMATINGCELYAVPVVSKGATSTGIRSFYASSDEGWMIRAGNKNGLLADKNDLPIDTGTLPRQLPQTQTQQAPKIATQKSPTY